MDDGSVMVFLLFWAVIAGGIGAAIGQKKGRAGEGFVLGLLIGPLGWLLVAVGKSQGPKCPHCHGEIDKGVTKCRHCGGDIVWE